MGRILLFMIGLGFSAVPVHAGPQPGKAAPAAPAKPARQLRKSEFKKGDAHWSHRGERERAEAGVVEYRRLFKKAPWDPETGWRLSMICYFTGLRYHKDDEEKRKYFTEGIEAGQTAIESYRALVKPKGAPKECAACHFWTAINKALYAETYGPLKVLVNLKKIDEHLKKSIEADPRYAYGGAYRLRGQIQWKLPGIFGGSSDDARKFYKKAMESAPDEPMNYLYMAWLLEDDFDDVAEALKVARKGLKVPKPAPDRLESREAIEDLRKFIEKHKPDSSG